MGRLADVEIDIVDDDTPDLSGEAWRRDVPAGGTILGHAEWIERRNTSCEESLSAAETP